MIPLSSYGYSVPEEYLMLIFAWITHIFMLPVILLTLRTREFWMTFMTTLTFVASLMYRTLDTITSFYIVLGEESWHRLCNIGTIASLLLVIIHLMDNQDPDLDTQLAYLGFTVSLLTQENNTWDLKYTFGPVFIAIFLAGLRIYARKRMPKYENFRMFKRGIVLVSIGVLFFIAGLNILDDYLRLYNGLWRIITSIGCFYLLQVKRKVGEEFNFFDMFTDKVHFE